MTEGIKKNALFTVSFAVFVGLRMVCHLCFPQIADAYGYFERAMIQTKEQNIILTDSGVAYAYTGALSALFRFVGNRIEVVWMYQMILQTAAVCLLVLGCYFLFGKAAACLCAVLSAVFPYLIQSLSIVSPENYFLFFFGLLFFLISLFREIAGRNGWYHNNCGKIFLILIGLFAGKLCIWHGFGLSILAVMVFVIFADAKNCSSRLAVLFVGAFLGGLCTLMKYTGVTGNNLKEQFLWWLQHLASGKNGLWQEMSPWICIYLGGIIIMSGMFGFWMKKKKRQPEEVTESAQTKASVARQINDLKEKQTTEDTMKVTYLENPLPVPKKHEKRTMDFSVKDKIDDFDFDVDENDDFDV